MPGLVITRDGTTITFEDLGSYEVFMLAHLLRDKRITFSEPQGSSQSMTAHSSLADDILNFHKRWLERPQKGQAISSKDLERLACEGLNVEPYSSKYQSLRMYWIKLLPILVKEEEPGPQPQT
jgi:hypothetical protein